MSSTFHSEQHYQPLRLALHLISFDSFNHFGAGDAGEVLENLIPQLCVSSPSVSAALAATGAAFHTMQAPSNASSTRDEAFAVSQYQIALNSVRRDLSLLPHDSLPMILTCFLLSIVEIFLQREENALFHLAGAAKLLQHRRSAGMTSDMSHSGISDLEGDFSADALGLLFRTVDFQTSSYAPSLPPRLPPLPIPPTLPEFSDLASAHKVLIPLTHSCYSFLAESIQIKHQQKPFTTVHQENQSRLIALLHTWLERFQLVVSFKVAQTPPKPPLSMEDCHALKLRMTALSVLIKISCATSPHEKAYDAHGLHFLQILADAEAVMSTRTGEADQQGGESSNRLRFSMGPGIIEPLFTVAFKYRHPLERRRAIALLKHSGREGPWNGVREARITSAVMAYEEGGLQDDSHACLDCSRDQISPASEDWQTRIPECSRLFDMGFSPKVSVHGRSNRVAARYRRCGVSWSEVLEF